MAYFPLHKKLPPNFDVLIPFYQFEKELVRELALLNVIVIYKNDNLIVVGSLKAKPVWAQDWWPNSKSLVIDSKSQIVKFLKSQPVLGYYYDSTQSKLARNLLTDLRSLELKRIERNSKFKFKYFTWTAVDETIIYCDHPSSRFPVGWHEFNEDKVFPPNRAYLKLWELFTAHNLQHNSNDSVIDVGSSPGGWSWVLSQYFKKVYSIDKAELDPRIKKIPNIQSTTGDAFKIDCSDFKDCNWIFSDIICTPDKSYDLINHWLQSSNIKNFVCTLKFKGDCDFEILKKCLLVEGSELIHLYQNKNEVTWIRQTK